MNFDKISNILVYGYGVEGKSSLKFLCEKFPDKNIHFFDKNADKKDRLFQKKTIEDYDLLVVSPGVDRRQFPVELQKKCTSQLEIFFAYLSEKKRQKVIGISGTKGKSTTTKFCFELLEKAGHTATIGGNYGIPVLEILDDFLKEKFEFVVLELSSYQLENLKDSPGIALFLNVYPEHLDRHQGYENYIEAKKNLWKFQKDDDILIIPRKIAPLTLPERANNIFYSEPISESYFPLHSLFKALHFRENFGTVFQLAYILDIPDVIFKKVCSSFKGLPHRLEFITKKNNIFFYNDSISTNPHSTRSALEFFRNRLGSLILGGKDRGIDYSLITNSLNEFSPNAFVIVLESETRPKLVELFKRTNFENYKVVSNMKEAVALAFEKTSKNKISLLSPAAASFDRFKNYQERGELFVKEIDEF